MTKTCKVAIITLITSLLLGGTFSLSQAEYNPAAIPEELIESMTAQDSENHAGRIISGFMHFDMGRFSKAEKHFAKAASIAPNDPYDQIWLYMSQVRQNAKAPDDKIRAFLKRNRSNEFVYTDIAILLGDISPDQGIEKAKVSNDLGNVCEANYYAAQRHFSDGNKKLAEEYLIKAINTKQESFWEYKSALAYLRQTIPGTGVSLVPPAGTTLAPAGTFLMDAKGEMIVSIIIRQAETGRDKELSKKLYPHFVRKIKVGNQVGDLHKRTRKVDGGGYDAWWLGIYRGDQLLQVTAYYTGSNDSVFRSMESIFNTVLWESGKEDRFLSFGYKTVVEGLSDISTVMGGLNFGIQKDSDSGVTLDLTPIPIVSEKIGNAMTYCNKLAAKIFVSELRSGPFILDKNGIELWEMTGQSKFNKSGTVDYIAFLKTPEGGFIQVTGKAPADSIEQWEERFREALFRMKRVR